MNGMAISRKRSNEFLYAGYTYQQEIDFKKTREILRKEEVDKRK